MNRRALGRGRLLVVIGALVTLAGMVPSWWKLPRTNEVALSGNGLEGAGIIIFLGVLVGGAAAALCAREMRPLAIVLGATPLQLSPHERAPTITPLEPGTAVLLLRPQAGWRMVSARPRRRSTWRCGTGRRAGPA